MSATMLDTRRCVCARYADGSVHTSTCPVHADTDPCLTMSWVTGRRRTGTIRRGVCTACGHGRPSTPDYPFPVGGRVEWSAMRGDVPVILTGTVTPSLMREWRLVRPDNAPTCVAVRVDNLTTGRARFLCKSCGAESPTGIGYTMSAPGCLPAPAPDCRHPHTD